VFPSRKLADIKLVGLASTSAEGARTLAAKYEIPEAYPTYEEMLSDSGIEAIYIAAPVQQRAELAVQALMANKHVLCLAPLAANARQACDLVVLAAQRRRSLVEAVDYRHHPLVERMRSLIQGNAIGQPRHATVSIKLPWYLRPKKAGDLRTDFNLGGGAAMHLGVHGLYVLRHLLGAEPTIVSAKPRLLDTDKRYRPAGLACVLKKWTLPLTLAGLRLLGRAAGAGSLGWTRPWRWSWCLTTWRRRWTSRRASFTRRPPPAAAATAAAAAAAAAAALGVAAAARRTARARRAAATAP